MGCCGGTSVSSDKNDPKVWFYKRRGCTDIFCLLIFGAFWVGLIYIAWLAITVGDPWAVFYGSDYLGNRCGVGGNVDKPKTFYPRIDKDLMDQAAIAMSMPWKLSFYGLCLEACPNVTTPTECFLAPDDCKVMDYGSPAQQQLAGGKSYYYATMPSVDVMNRCVPSDSNSMTQAADRCAFPQCDNDRYSPCDTEYPTLWELSFPKSLDCEVIFRTGTINQLRPAALNPLTEKLGANVATMQRIVNSVTTSWREIVIFGVATPIVLGFVWLVLLRLFAGIFTYVMITLIGVALCGLSLYLWVRAGLVEQLQAALAANSTVMPTGLNNTVVATGANATLAAALGVMGQAEDAVAAIAPSDLTATMNSAEGEVPALWLVLAIIVTILTLVYVISMIAARKQIRTAVALVKTGSMVIKDRPATMFFPFNALVVQLLLAFAFILLFLFLQTAPLTIEHFQGVANAATAASSYASNIEAYDSSMNDGGAAGIEAAANNAFTFKIGLYLYVLFGFLWTIESVNNLGWTTMSGSVSHWFFFRNSIKTKIPLMRSLYRAARYHLGTIVFGSFIVAVIQLIRIILMALDHYTKKQQNSNLMLKLLIKCTQCCMWCLEKTIKFITNYCYIYVAMQGAGFCKACFATFALIVTNPAQLAINTFVRTILSWIQLLGLPVASGWLCNVVLVQQGAAESMWPTIIVAICAYVIAKVFTLVFSCVLDTLFVCCCRDRAEYEGEHMPDALKKVFGFKKSKKKKPAEEEDDEEDDDLVKE